MTNSISRREEQPTDPLSRLGVKSDPSLLMTDYMSAWRSKFENDPTNILPAIKGLQSVASYYWQFPDEQGSDSVGVPFWVVEVLSEGFFRYENARSADRTTTLGEAFGLEGGGQGKQPKLKEQRTIVRDRNIALSIAMQIAEELTVEEAVNLVAEQHSLSEKTVWPIWSKYKDLAQSSLNNYQTLKTSGSDESD